MQDFQKLNYQKYTPSNALTNVVQAIWFADNQQNAEALTFKILSDGAAGIVLNFGDVITYQRKDSQLSVHKGCITNGPSTDLLRVSFSGCIYAVGFQFYPATAHYFFNGTLDKLSEKFLLTSSTHFWRINDLYSKIEKILSQKENKEIIVSLVEAHLLQIFNRTQSKQKQMLTQVINTIIESSDLSIAKLSEQQGISVRDIQRLFKKQVGISAKSLMGLYRVRRVKEKIESDDFKSLTSLATDHGYYDQAHFTRDFKKLMEDSPRQYHRYKKRT